MRTSLATFAALATLAAACGPPELQTATLPPKPLAPSPSALVIGVVPAESRGETPTPVAGEARSCNPRCAAAQ